MKPSPNTRRRDRRLARGYGAFMAEAKAATLLDAHPAAGLSLLLLAVILAAAYYWASRATLDEVTIGYGKVIPSNREQVIQSLEGGILSALLVKEGDVVDKGQVLLRIDDTRFNAALQEGRSRSMALRAAIARLRAEADGRKPVFPPDIRPELIKPEMDLYQSRSRALEDSLAALRRSYQLADEELKMTAPLVEKGVVSEVELLRLKRQVNELRAQMLDRYNKFRADARAELAKNEAELAAVSEINTARADQVKRTTIRAPMRGIVKNIKVTTVGGVIQPGMDIMEIVPLEDQLLIEARVRPSDIAFLHPGQPATVKITAYDYSIYGGLKGTLEYISPDTITDEKNPHESFYRIQVRTEHAYLHGKEGKLPIIPGMTATVEILTGHKTVLDYVLKPLLKAKETALRER